MSSPATSSGDGQLSYLNIVFSEKGLSEFSQGRRVVFIPKDEVQKIEIGYGSGAERPLLQLIAGLLLTGLGCAGLGMVFESGMRGLRWGIGFMVFGGLGVWCLYEAFTKTHYLRVTCQKETRKLVFKGAFQEQAFSEYIKNARHLGYVVDAMPTPGGSGTSRSSI